MISRQLLYEFAPWEAEAYDRQRIYAGYRLTASADRLDAYSDHSFRHVTEVMENCEMLFSVLRPWLKTRFGGAEPEAMLDELMVAAKLHDVRMGGDDAEFRLLGEIDDLCHRLAGENDWSDLPERVDRLIGAANDAAIFPESEHIFRALAAARRSPVAGLWADARAALSDFHDRVKDSIRRRHAPAGGKWVIDRAERVRGRYGEGLNLSAVALLIALHSTSSTHCTVVAADDPSARAVIRDFVDAILPDEEQEGALEDGFIRRLTAMAAVLRLADTRRDGPRLHTLGGFPIEPAFDGVCWTARVVKPGGVEEIPERLAHEILLSEACTRFGEVTLADFDGWVLGHAMTLDHWSDPGVCDAFARRRLPSYLSEIRTGELGGMENCIIVTLPGASARDRSRIGARFGELGGEIRIVVRS